MKKKNLFVALGAIVILALLIWRMLPHSLEEILPSGNDNFSRINVQITEFSSPDHSLNLSVYAIETTSPIDDHYKPIIEMIKNTDYRSDFRNLLPWDITTVNSESNNIEHSAIIKLVSESTEETYVINFHGERVVSFDFGVHSEFRVYHPTNRELLSQLVEYVKTNGVIVK